MSKLCCRPSQTWSGWYRLGSKYWHCHDINTATYVNVIKAENEKSWRLKTKVSKLFDFSDKHKNSCKIKKMKNELPNGLCFQILLTLSS